MSLIYKIGLGFYRIGISLVSPWNSKARMWIKGRKNWKNKIKKVFKAEDDVIWIHCSSLGEFEQGRPIIEKIRKEKADYKLLLTFFSPSGYEKRKDYDMVDHVAYLPYDTRKNAEYFLETVPVKKAIFIKYEFWFHFIDTLSRKDIPVYLVSGIFRKSQPFFKWYGGWYRQMLHKYSHIYVQDESSLLLLKEYNIPGISIAGDTRFDRVMDIAEQVKSYSEIEAFTEGKKVLLGGSTWKEDEEILQKVFDSLNMEWCMILAPHEPSDRNLGRLSRMFADTVLLTELFEGKKTKGRVLIVDTIGHLSSLYKYGTLAFIGGGFGKGIHNILEATAAGLPVLFGPAYENFKEAVDLVELGGAFSVRSLEEVLEFFTKIESDQEYLQKLSDLVRKYTEDNTGATEIVVNGIFEEVLSSI